MAFQAGRNNNRNQEPVKHIAEGITVSFKPNSYVSEAEEVIKACKNELHFKVRKDKITYSQLRKILAMTSTIYDLANMGDVETALEKVQYFKIQLIYTAGRNEAMREFIDASRLVLICDLISKYAERNKPVRKKLIRLCKYMEALVAYFKYYGGED